jgi:hypothetical protein
MSKILKAIAEAEIPVPLRIWIFSRVILVLAAIGTIWAAFSMKPFDFVNMLMLAGAGYIFYDIAKDVSRIRAKRNA